MAFLNIMKNKDIICISTSDWRRPWGSKQHLMTKLSEYNRVLYIEYQSSLLDFIRYPGYAFKKLSDINKLRKISENIYIYTPIPTFPFGFHSIFINKINQLILGFFLIKLINKLKFKDLVLWFYSPISAYQIGRMNESAVVYHCIADFIHEKRNYFRKITINILERCLIQRAHIVLTLTQDLQKRFKELNQNTFYFPSAVNIAYFSEVRSRAGDEPKDISLITGPRLGVVGYLDGNILDIDLLDYIAKANPGWSIVMIGPLFRKSLSLLKLNKNKNVSFLGEKTPSLIPQYLKYLDVCLIPYMRNEFTHNVSAIKLYEYLAMGKPVVSTFFSDELAGLETIIGIAEDKKQFLESIRYFLNCKDDREKLAARINFAADNSWQKRLDFLADKI